MWPSWERVTAESKNLEHFMSDFFPKKFGLDNDNNNGWILDINYNTNTENKSSAVDHAAKINSQILASLDGGVGVGSLKANVVPLDFIFSTNLIEVSIYVNQQKALLTHNHVVINN